MTRTVSSTTRYFFFVHILNLPSLSLINQDEGVVMGTVWGDGHGPAGLPDAGSICGEPVHKGTAGTRHTGKH